jgi:hypothetical protein
MIFLKKRKGRVRMDWKLGYGSLGLIALLLICGMVWCNRIYAPLEVSAAIIMEPAPVLNPYPELEGVRVHINTASEEELQQLPNMARPERKQSMTILRHTEN